MKKVLNRSVHDLKKILSEKIDVKREALIRLKENQKMPFEELRVNQVLDGMKGMRTILCETSKVDSKGLKFRGYSLPDLINSLPGKYKQPYPESVFWFLLTGEIPTYAQVQSLISELSQNASLPKSTEDLLFSLPKEMDPMTQLSIGIQSLNEHSVFTKHYKTSEHWELMLEDSLFLISKLPRIGGIIYRNTFKNSKVPDPGPYDLAENLGRMLGWSDDNFFEALRLYTIIHSDHEGGNVSTHATKLVGSTLANAFQSYSAGVNGLAGPIHGKGIQFCLMWLVEMWKSIGSNIDEESIEVYVKTYLKHNEKIPGFGHPILRYTDSRFLVQMEYADKYLKDDDLCNIIKISSKVIPDILKHHGKKNPYPNMYLCSGGILYHFGLRMYEYYPVLFAIARALGALSNLVWDRALLLDIERPDSITLNELA